MDDKTIMDDSTLAEAGWSVMHDTGFICLIGPFWQRDGEHGLEIGLPTSDRHRNRSGIVQGGVICTLADRALGTASRAVTDNRPVFTVKLDTTFLDKAAVGDLLVARPRIVKQTRSLIFGEVSVFAGTTLVAAVSGIFKPSRAPAA